MAKLITKTFSGTLTTPVNIAAETEKAVWTPADASKTIKIIGFEMGGTGASAAMAFQFRDGAGGTAVYNGQLTAAGVQAQRVEFVGGLLLTTGNALVFISKVESAPWGSVWGYEVGNEATAAFYPNEKHSRPANAKDNALFEALPGGGAG